MPASLLMDLGVLLPGSVFSFFISCFITGFQPTVVFHNLTEGEGELNTMIRNNSYWMYM